MKPSEAIDIKSLMKELRSEIEFHRIACEEELGGMRRFWVSDIEALLDEIERLNNKIQSKNGISEKAKIMLHELKHISPNTQLKYSNSTGKFYVETDLHLLSGIFQISPCEHAETPEDAIISLYSRLAETSDIVFLDSGNRRYIFRHDGRHFLCTDIQYIG